MYTEIENRGIRSHSFKKLISCWVIIRGEKSTAIYYSSRNTVKFDLSSSKSTRLEMYLGKRKRVVLQKVTFKGKPFINVPIRPSLKLTEYISTKLVSVERGKVQNDWTVNGTSHFTQYS